MNIKNVSSKMLLVLVFFVALYLVPANSSFIFGYGSVLGASVAAPVCDKEKPGSAPVLLSAVPSGPNSITLTWTRANDPVTLYLITFGNHPGEQLYGNPDVGNITSYTINSLSGGSTYYFKVRAGNGCKPGDFSNELSASPTGGYISPEIIPGGFAPGVLGAKTQVTPTPEILPTGVVVPPRELGFFERIWHFILGLFGK